MGSLSRYESLKKGADFNRVYKSDKRWHDKSFVLFAVPNAPRRRVGFVASKKLGNAVKRNRAKRRLRALFLRMMPHLTDGEYILVAKPPVLQTPFAQMQRAFERAIKRLDIAKQGGKE